MLTIWRWYDTWAFISNQCLPPSVISRKPVKLASTEVRETNELAIKTLLFTASHDLVTLFYSWKMQCVCGRVVFFISRATVYYSLQEWSVLFKHSFGLGFCMDVWKNHSIILVLYSALYIKLSCLHRVVGAVCTEGWPLNSIPMYPTLMLFCSILLCVERCGLIAHWAKLVFLHLGERSELGANVAPCGFLNGITMADRLWLRDFNGTEQGDSQKPLLNAAWESVKLTVCICISLKIFPLPLLCWNFSQRVAFCQKSVFLWCCNSSELQRLLQRNL